MLGVFSLDPIFPLPLQLPAPVPTLALLQGQSCTFFLPQQNSVLLKLGRSHEPDLHRQQAQGLTTTPSAPAECGLNAWGTGELKLHFLCCMACGPNLSYTAGHAAVPVTAGETIFSVVGLDCVFSFRFCRGDHVPEGAA